MCAFLDDETLNLSRVGIMFGLHSCVRDDLLSQPGVTGNTINDKPTKLLQLLVLGVSGTVVGLQEFMATSPAPLCETLLSAGANPNSRWAGNDGGTLWTHLLFYYATSIEDSRGVPDVATIMAFVSYGADLTVSVDFRGARFSPSSLVRSLLKDFPRFMDELTRLLELLEARTTTLTPSQISTPAPTQQACGPRLASPTPAATSFVADTLKGESSLCVSSGSRTSVSSSRSVISKTPSVNERQRGLGKGRLLRKIFRGKYLVQRESSRD